MSGTKPDPNRRFQIALDRSRAEWASTEPALAAALAGCACTPDGISVPFFGKLHLVTHPLGEVMVEPLPGKAATMGVQIGSPAKPAHPSIAIMLLHYLTTADGTRLAERWVTFRELPHGLFYAQAFAGHAEGLLAEKFGTNPDRFRRQALAMGGTPLDLANASFRFQALPRFAIAALLWTGDDEFPGQARILFDASAGHYLPTEDLSGIGDWLAHHLAREAD
jgi:hypothetical protein